MQKLLILSITLCGTIKAQAGIMSRVYSAVLGNNDVSTTFKNETYEALRALGIQDPTSVQVKQMNGIGPALARANIGSFTACGIWLDEQYLAGCSTAAATFHIYHEAAHYVLRHHRNLVLGTLAVCAAAAAILLKIKPRSYQFAAGAAALGSYLVCLPYYVREQEKQADLLAVQTLLATGKHAVVASHLAALAKLHDHDNALWWYSPQDQIRYLKDFIEGN
jgi:hypothetical protein